ncbi:MAG: nucleotide exchange factor GrpE [Nitrospirota bacterium]
MEPEQGERMTPDGAAPESAAAESPETGGADWEAHLAAKDRECADAKDRYLRLYAEFDNYKRRAQRDQQDYTKFAAEKVLKELLPIVDNLERAVAHARGAQADASIVDGLALIVRQFHDALHKNGCEPIDAVGKPFDPAFHQALAQIDAADRDPDTVVEEAQRGYLLHGRILRPSMVTVSKKPDAT